MADWKKWMDGAAESVGRGLRGAADGARKVVGIGVGKISIDGPQRAYRGDQYCGEVILELSEPIEDSTLEVSLEATRKRITIEKNNGRTGTRTVTDTVFKRVVQVSQAGTHESGTYPFEIDVPSEESEIEVEGWLGNAVRAAQALKAMTEGELRWSVIATLEVPWRRNLKTKIPVTLVSKVHSPAEKQVAGSGGAKTGFLSNMGAGADGAGPANETPAMEAKANVAKIFFMVN